MCAIFVALNSIANAVILFKYDARIKQNIYDIFDIRTRKTSVRKQNSESKKSSQVSGLKAEMIKLDRVQLRHAADLDTVQLSYNGQR